TNTGCAAGLGHFYVGERPPVRDAVSGRHRPASGRTTTMEDSPTQRMWSKHGGRMTAILVTLCLLAATPLWGSAQASPAPTPLSGPRARRGRHARVMPDASCAPGRARAHQSDGAAPVPGENAVRR